MIPKIIHQTARTAEISPEWLPFQRAVQDLHPGWEYHLWTDADNDALVAERFPDLLVAFRGLPKGIMRADIIRYVLMHEFGGWYLDLDYEMLRPFPDSDRDIVLPRESADNDTVYLGNSIFASSPGHPYWKAVLEEFLLNHPGPMDSPSEHEITQITGPGLLTRVWAREFQKDTSIFIPSRNAFNPMIPGSDSEYKALTRQSSIYGIHHCYGTWRALTMRQRLAEKVRSMAKGVVRLFIRKREHQWRAK